MLVFKKFWLKALAGRMPETEITAAVITALRLVTQQTWLNAERRAADEMKLSYAYITSKAVLGKLAVGSRLTEIGSQGFFFSTLTSSSLNYDYIEKAFDQWIDNYNLRGDAADVSIENDEEGDDSSVVVNNSNSSSLRGFSSDKDSPINTEEDYGDEDILTGLLLETPGAHTRSNWQNLSSMTMQNTGSTSRAVTASSFKNHYSQDSLFRNIFEKDVIWKIQDDTSMIANIKKSR
jgi:hypothetical protein